MVHTDHFQVVSPILTVDAKSSGFVALPAGAVITTTDDLAEPGLHEVRCYDKTLLAFSRDIQERTKELSSASVA
jgi:hypothetical protein